MSPWDSANFTPEREGSNEQNRYAYRGASAVLGFPQVEHLALNNLNGNCPIESTLQKYTESSNPKAVMEQGD
ncbi:MAG: hypothetical protein HC773_00295 [Scytonema sp. CRU_2_7]|nr:hypothetical protein [Scytonema sp. CRU_2_7]